MFAVRAYRWLRAEATVLWWRVRGSRIRRGFSDREIVDFVDLMLMSQEITERQAERLRRRMLAVDRTVDFSGCTPQAARARVAARRRAA